jgi:RHS repeat-associated protein
MRLGNGKFESTVFNSRLQPTQIALGTTANATDLLKLEYDYGTQFNNGNVLQQKITVPNMAAPFVQTYVYDSLNRLQSATETSNSTQSWKQTFIFDRYGNRSFDSANTTTFPTGCPTTVCNPSFNQSNNRMNDNQGYEYNSAGNVTKDATNKRFVYDAENKQTSFGTDGSYTNGGSYFYDGDGRRVKKVVGTETTVFVYNASGQMVAEYSTTAPTNPQTSYLTTDTLGSPRINTNANGQVTARHDYLPFGEEIIGLGQRSTELGYNADNVKQKYTSKERDDETSFDYFGARYYSSSLGRFTSVDQGTPEPSDPQSWHRYRYARNNPLYYVDPDGNKDEPAKDKRINEALATDRRLLEAIRKSN